MSAIFMECGGLAPLLRPPDSLPLLRRGVYRVAELPDRDDFRETAEHPRRRTFCVAHKPVSS